MPPELPGDLATLVAIKGFNPRECIENAYDENKWTEFFAEFLSPHAKAVLELASAPPILKSLERLPAKLPHQLLAPFSDATFKLSSFSFQSDFILFVLLVSFDHHFSEEAIEQMLARYKAEGRSIPYADFERLCTHFLTVGAPGATFVKAKYLLSGSAFLTLLYLFFVQVLIVKTLSFLIASRYCEPVRRKKPNLRS